VIKVRSCSSLVDGACGMEMVGCPIGCCCCWDICDCDDDDDDDDDDDFS